MGTFGSFGTVRLGIYAAQKGLDVTGNNITNINTEGYSRQRLNQVSLIPGAADRYFSSYKTRIGQGAVVAGVDQLRDPGLDISYRKAVADVGSANAKLGGLNDLATILDEVGKGDLEQDDGVILSQLNDLRDLINQAITNGVGTYNSLIRESASSLTTLFNSYAQKLSDLKVTYEDKLNQQVDEVNNILKQIQDLNVAIRNSDIRGDEGLELRDQRNLLLDELNEYVKVDVKYSMEDIGAETYVEKLTVTIASQEGHSHTLIDGVYGSQIGVANTDDYKINLYALRDPNGNKKDPNDNDPMTLVDNDLYGSLQSIRELLTEKGEYATAAEIGDDKDASTKRGIPYYQMALDNLAQTFATEMNKLNDTGLEGAGALFSNSSSGNATDNITAANISVSYDWANDKVSIQATADPNAPSGDTSRLAEFLNLFNREDISFDPGNINAGAAGNSYVGSFEDMLLRIQSTLAEDQMTTDAVLNNYMITANDIYVDRDGVMGVDLNDEATSLMTYQKAYSAACKLMTTLETALDSLLAM